MTILQRLSSKVPIQDPTYVQMKALIAEGKTREAAELAVHTDGFLNNTVRDFATKMSNREESMSADLNDMVATIIGIARDDLDARQMLTGDSLYYAPNAGLTNSDLEQHIVRSNLHYAELETKRLNLAKILSKAPSQQVIINGQMQPMPDSAGVLTSRAFMSSHAAAGTNRRLVEFSMSQFLCAPIASWANTSIPDGYVGRDIGRLPSTQYKSKCVGCHAPMDALQPAFAHLDFSFSETTGFIDYMKSYPFDPDPTNPSVLNVAVPAAEQKVVTKFRRGKEVFPLGFAVQNNHWENFIETDLGWKTSRQGTGLKDFGRMLAETDAFSQCMALRAFSVVCYDPIATTNLTRKSPVIQKLAKDFEASGYNLRSLFAETVTQPECLEGL